LEKAFAAHCGGWDKIDGGSPDHAWKILTGCRDCYTLMSKNQGRSYRIYGKLSNQQLANSPHEGDRGVYEVEWPAAGGGGGPKELSSTEVFVRLAAWEQNNYMMAAGTRGGSDSDDTDGIVDGHAYSVLDVQLNVANSRINMIKVRNPWGKGEFENGKWVDNGSGWTEHPRVKDALNPVQADDGIFWMEEEEFFQYFFSIYLCAQNMEEFLDGYHVGAAPNSFP
jgi:hypothetical protein